MNTASSPLKDYNDHVDLSEGHKHFLSTQHQLSREKGKFMTRTECVWCDKTVPHSILPMP
jgi:hypothetical protein